MTYWLFFIMFIVGFIDAFFEVRILCVYDERLDVGNFENEEDYGWYRFKSDISWYLLAAEEGILAVVCKSLNYGVAWIVCFSVVLWASYLGFGLVFYKLEKKRNNRK